MIGKLIGAVAGERLARNVSGVSETGGAIIGALAVPLARRLGPVGLVAAAAGGYALKRYYEKKQIRDRAAELAREIAALSVTLHSTLVTVAVRRALES